LTAYATVLLGVLNGLSIYCLTLNLLIRERS
jgi:hypothetical protein